MIKVTYRNLFIIIQINGQPPSTRNCHSSTQFGQYLIVFGGREGDGKKRIVNDIFIFDTGIISIRLRSDYFRKILMVLAQGGQVEVASASNGPLELALEWQPYHYIRWMEWILGALGCHIHRS